MPVRGESIHVHEGVHVFGDDDLFVSKPLMENLDGLLVLGRRKRDRIECCAVEKGSQIVEFINIREAGIEMDGGQVQIPPYRISIESG